MKRILLVSVFILGFGGPAMAQSPAALLGGVVTNGAGTLLFALQPVLLIASDLPGAGLLLNSTGGFQPPAIGGALVGDLPIPSLDLIGDLLTSFSGGGSSGFLGGGLLADGIPVVGGLLGGEGGLLVIGDLLGGEGGLLLIGDLLDGFGSGDIPIVGALLGGAALAGGGQGLALTQIPLSLANLDPATALALVNGVTLPGL